MLFIQLVITPRYFRIADELLFIMSFMLKNLYLYKLNEYILYSAMVLAIFLKSSRGVTLKHTKLSLFIDKNYFVQNCLHYSSPVAILRV
ncbi:hypothetical protein PSECIP111951_03064 [Pseudoalteromonas holothuriae]|uniref:Uncharacterized protein n=1 Tax=Pseudoalteromonas holothuriae TaxID=2963714 RepID=A0A9W4QZJ2_9GAMM|nr:hypothetical protein PSECIP111854_02454 [Pseudoalteromonas sp. CIP111854]CAH9064166.1 hypothetical protein PSECIP111951_03064 [Pseudoalteromonas sp. CIP111951]